ncbi:MAG: cytochrome C oxidase subunit IV family protein [Candidatus Kapaibacterium sp.]|jgi:cytochrome c oxidase subunit 4
MSGHNENTSVDKHEHVPSYGKNVMIWLALVALTALTVTVASVNLGNYTFFVAMLIASIKAMLVINIFMHIKYDDILMKSILIACGLVFAVIIIMYSFDLFNTYTG